MSAPRRIGTEDSKTRALLLDAAARLMLEAGYAAVTSRRVAAKAGIKPALVHYYFRTMDDLFLALFRRGAELNLERLTRMLAEPRPLHAIWKLDSDPTGTALMMEFAALANHRKAIRSELAAYAERFRQAEADAAVRTLRANGVDTDKFAIIVPFLMSAISRTLVMEEALGLTMGHSEVAAFVLEKLGSLEPEDTTP